MLFVPGIRSKLWLICYGEKRVGRLMRTGAIFRLPKMASVDYSEYNPIQWEIVLEADLSNSFSNRISGSYEIDEPPPFRGGIIADPMGLGKTLTMIALAASDVENPDSAWYAFQQLQHGKQKAKATLVIVPPPCK